MTKTSRKAIIFMLMLILVGLYFVSGTYARYTSSVTGNTTVQTADWAVAFKDGDGTELQEDTTFTLNFEVAKNTNVVSGKIAPGTTATATIEVDLAGTEVAVDYEASITKTALESVFGTDSQVTVETTATVNGQGDTTGTISLPNGEAFDSTNGKVVITISLVWANSDVDDTGAAGKTLTLPVTLTLKQHI